MQLEKRTITPRNPKPYTEIRLYLAHVTLGKEKDPFCMNVRNPIAQKYKGSLTLIQYSSNYEAQTPQPSLPKLNLI